MLIPLGSLSDNSQEDLHYPSKHARYGRATADEPWCSQEDLLRNH